MSAEGYAELVKATTGYLGAYPLVVPISVGDYLQLNAEGVLVHLGNVFNWPGWTDDVLVDTTPIGGSETYFAGCTRETSVDSSAGVKSPLGLGAEATVSLIFEKENGFVLAYEAATRQKVREVPDVQRKIIQLARDGQWQKEWFLVTEVISAESATLAVSTSSGSKVSLHANAQLPKGLSAIQIADPKLGWTASSWGGSGFSSVCKAGTPLYHCIRVRKGWFNSLLSDTLGPQDMEDAFAVDDPFFDV
ncbi:hypothetical protein NicSoilB11_17620 [Arthrobacter sp. NicSoilB11]|nr:hypothetical protein NicSoilB11_17620 [Arthrobacter sp. NicSoilB11]